MGRGSSFFDRINERRTLRRWQRAAQSLDHLGADGLRSLRGQARNLRNEIDGVLRATQSRLQAAFPDTVALTQPAGSDWAWRPELWRTPVQPVGLAGAQNRAQLGRELTLFHDCTHSEITLRQQRNWASDTIAPYGLRMDVLGFDGSFLSLVIDLPESALRGLQLNHLLRLEMDLALERPLEIFCRLNIKHGPNHEQLVRELPGGGGAQFVEFDLAYTRMNEKRLEKAWVDIIFESPRLNEIELRDVTFARYPRAEI
ncbi:DUF6478 family protein [Thioclava pacifica]|uniref:DUF6478 family protein n=1 Tax=Thioclava pacifica TaxID=285109 RepID=UPI000AA0A8E7|nr:DUF6478 family protein [Thioclava pacifica]